MKKRKKRRVWKKTYTKKELQDLVLNIFRANPTKNYNYKQLYKAIGNKAPETKMLIVSVLVGLHKNGSVLEVRAGKYKLFNMLWKKLDM